MRINLLATIVPLVLFGYCAAFADELAVDLHQAQPCAGQQATPAPPPPQFGGCLCCRPKLTGDWHGRRGCYAQNGITLDADVTQFYFGVVEGGLDRKFDYGGHGDYVWATGKFRNPPERDLETWFIPGGCAGAALYTFLQPGIYAYVNHNLIEAFELGAAGHFKVEGEWNDDLMKQVQAPVGM